MRIAILLPMDNNRAEAKTAVSLAGELAARGHDTTLFAASGVDTKAKTIIIPPAEASDNTKNILHIAAAMERGDEFEIIHNFAGSSAVAFCAMTTTPLLTTNTGGLADDMKAMKQKYAGRAFFACTSRVYCPDDGNCIEVAGDENDIVQLAGKYLEVYKKILDGKKREDHRPWGYYVIYADAPDHKVKRIVVYPGQRLSLQKHHRRAEHWYVMKGKAVVTLGDRDIELEAGEAVDLPLGTWHRMRNPGDVDMHFIEVQTGDYFGEDDIERAQDDYGRS